MPDNDQTPLEELLFSLAAVAIDEDHSPESRRTALLILYRYLTKVLVTPEGESDDPYLDRLDKIIEEKKRAVS
jgi:hypothetical protein